MAINELNSVLFLSIVLKMLLILSDDHRMLRAHVNSNVAETKWTREDEILLFC